MLMHSRSHADGPPWDCPPVVNSSTYTGEPAVTVLLNHKSLSARWQTVIALAEGEASMPVVGCGHDGIACFELMKRRDTHRRFHWVLVDRACWRLISDVLFLVSPIGFVAAQAASFRRFLRVCLP